MRVAVRLCVALVAAAAAAQYMPPAPLGKFELLQYDAVANASAVVVAGGKARFTVLTDRVRAGLARCLSLCCPRFATSHAFRDSTHKRTRVHTHAWGGLLRGRRRSLALSLRRSAALRVK
jgi:hypothetical protein